MFFYFTSNSVNTSFADIFYSFLLNILHFFNGLLKKEIPTCFLFVNVPFLNCQKHQNHGSQQGKDDHETFV